MVLSHIAARLSTIRNGMPHYRAQHELQKYVPRDASRALHITLVTLGRKICRSNIPACTGYVIKRYRNHHDQKES